MGRTSDAKQRLIQAAQALFHARSYEGVSVEELCREADVRKGSFYHFFASKRALALAALDAWWAGIRSDVLEPSFTADVPPLERIRLAFSRSAVRQAAAQERTGCFVGCPFGNLAMELSTQDEVIRTRVAETLERMRGYFAEALREAQARGDLSDPAADPDDMARSLLAFLYGSMVLAKAANDAAVMSSLTDSALRLVAQGSVAPPSA